MGADLLVAVLPIREGREPDWDAGHRWIDATSDNDLETTLNEGAASGPEWYLRIEERLAEEGLEETPPELLREELHGVVNEVKEAVDQDYRSITWFTWDGWNFITTGGMSYGDSPSEEFEPFNALADVQELAKAIGFFDKSPVAAKVAI